MHEASASAIDDRGVGIPLPYPKNPLKYTSIPNNTTDQSIPLSIPAKHFEHFERSIHQVNNSIASMSNDCVIASAMPSSSVSHV